MTNLKVAHVGFISSWWGCSVLFWWHKWTWPWLSAALLIHWHHRSTGTVLTESSGTERRVGSGLDLTLPSQTASSLLFPGLGRWRKVLWSLINLFYPLLFDSVCWLWLGWTCESLQIPAVIHQSSYHNATVEYFLMSSLWSSNSRFTAILVNFFFPKKNYWDCLGGYAKLELWKHRNKAWGFCLVIWTDIYSE